MFYNYFNEKIYEDLKWLDQKDGGDRAKTYFMQYHLKMFHKTEKLMKKLYGKQLAREIAFGRKMVKMMKGTNETPTT